MLVAIEDVVDEAVDDGGLAHGLVAQEDYLVLQQRRDRALRQVQVADVRHTDKSNTQNIAVVGIKGRRS